MGSGLGRVAAGLVIHRRACGIGGWGGFVAGGGEGVCRWRWCRCMRAPARFGACRIGRVGLGGKRACGRAPACRSRYQMAALTPGLVDGAVERAGAGAPCGCAGSAGGAPRDDHTGVVGTAVAQMSAGATWGRFATRIVRIVLQGGGEGVARQGLHGLPRATRSGSTTAPTAPEPAGIAYAASSTSSPCKWLATASPPVTSATQVGTVGFTEALDTEGLWSPVVEARQDDRARRGGDSGEAPIRAGGDMLRRTARPKMRAGRPPESVHGAPLLHRRRRFAGPAPRGRQVDGSRPCSATHGRHRRAQVPTPTRGAPVTQAARLGATFTPHDDEHQAEQSHPPAPDEAAPPTIATTNPTSEPPAQRRNANLRGHLLRSTL